jgi:hypothetical protein
LCGSTVGGAVGISGASGFVLVGDPGDDLCAPDSIGGILSLTSNTAGVEVSSSRIGGNVVLNNNSGRGRFAEDSRPEVEANTIGGRLSCAGNTPAPTNDGQPNTKGGSSSGQCIGV